MKRFEQKWNSKYGYAIKAWKDNWDNLTHYFDYPNEIRQIIYTTNAIESLNSGIRKYTKTKTVFPDDSVALKSVYLAIRNIEKKWTMPIRNWGTILNQFMIILNLFLNLNSFLFSIHNHLLYIFRAVGQMYFYDVHSCLIRHGYRSVHTLFLPH